MKLLTNRHENLAGTLPFQGEGARCGDVDIMAREEPTNQMIAYKRTVTIQNPRELVLNDLPFEAGQRVEVVMLAEEASPDVSLSDLRALFRKTQALPAAWLISEEEIAAEIEAYRAGLRESSN